MTRPRSGSIAMFTQSGTVGLAFLEDVKTTGVSRFVSYGNRIDVDEADIIVAGGRGVGKGESFKIIHELADAVGGTVGGTRPVIDWNLLPFERQIGQTGKTVSPRLMFACGISGANEFTAGMENAKRVIAINKDPNSRIFKFADLGIVGDVHTQKKNALIAIQEKANKPFLKFP